MTDAARERAEGDARIRASAWLRCWPGIARVYGGQPSLLSSLAHAFEHYAEMRLAAALRERDEARERAEQIHKEWLAHGDWEAIGSWGSQTGEVLVEMIAAALRERDEEVARLTEERNRLRAPEQFEMALALDEIRELRQRAEQAEAEVARLTEAEADWEDKYDEAARMLAAAEKRAERAERERNLFKTQLDADNLYLYNEVKYERDEARAERDRLRQCETGTCQQCLRCVKEDHSDLLAERQKWFLEAMAVSDRGRRLEEALAEAGGVLEALHLAGGTGVTTEIATAVQIVRAALAPPEVRP